MTCLRFAQLLLLFPLLLLACEEEEGSLADGETEDGDRGDALQDCLDACEKPTSHSQVCGEDGWIYGNECHLACYGLELAEDELLCAAPIENGECTEDKLGWQRRIVTSCGDLHPAFCEGTPNGWLTWDGPICYPSPAPCFADCPPCPEDENDFICGKKGVRYCNACVMECLEDEAGEVSACGVTASPAHFCDPETERYATRNWWGSVGCNVCECAPSGLWHCTFWACPGEEFP